MLPQTSPIEHKLPDYNGFGSIEDSEQNCKRIVPGDSFCLLHTIVLFNRSDRPKKNYLKMLINGNEQLRFEAVMATNSEIDKDRRFIISLRLSDDMIGTVFDF